jgi:hypothetical protein
MLPAFLLAHYQAFSEHLSPNLYISLIVACVDKILSDTRPKTVTGVVKNATKSTKKKQPAPVKTLRLASGQEIAFGSVVPKN